MFMVRAYFEHEEISKCIEGSETDDKKLIQAITPKHIKCTDI